MNHRLGSETRYKGYFLPPAGLTSSIKYAPAPSLPIGWITVSTQAPASNQAPCALEQGAFPASATR